MREVELPSGAKLSISLASFEDGKNLYQCIASELKSLKFDENEDVGVNFFKDIFLTALSSKEIEKLIMQCAKKALYNKERITQETFEPEDARQDYIEALYHIAENNLAPFGKALFAKYAPLFQQAMKGQKQE